MRTRLLLLFIVQSVLCAAQSKDTIRKYLDKDLEFTNRSGMVYKAVAFLQNERWTLVASYPDERDFIIASYADRALTLRDGPFTVFYSNGFKALEGNFESDQREGIWQSWYTNGKMKDSGYITRNSMSGTWVYGYENGKTHIRAEFKKVNLQPAIKTSKKKKDLLGFPEVASVKNGSYQSWYSNGSVKDSGTFHTDQRAGFWKFWHNNGKLESAGFFVDNNTMDGDWIFYREDGSVSTREKYKDNKLVALACFNEKGDSTGTSCSIAKLPVFLGSPYDWKTFLDRNIEWSKETVRKNDNGYVRINITIGKDGKLAHYTIPEDTDDLVKQDVERTLKTMTTWSPAVLHNREFEYSLEYTLTYSFR